MRRYIVDNVCHTDPDKCCCKEFNNVFDAMEFYDELTYPLRDFVTKSGIENEALVFYYRLPSTGKLGGNFTDSYVKIKSYEL